MTFRGSSLKVKISIWYVARLASMRDWRWVYRDSGRVLFLSPGGVDGAIVDSLLRIYSDDMIYLWERQSQRRLQRRL